MSNRTLTPLYVLVQRIRDFINEPRRKQILLSDLELWNQLCSSMDVLGDSELAVVAYQGLSATGEPGDLYLGAYGLLQALYLEQDAVNNLCESLQIEESIEKYPRLLQIREVRNFSVGHPTKMRGVKRSGRPPSYNYISRPTLRREGFQIISFFTGGQHEFVDVNIPELIADQHAYLEDILKRVVTYLQDDEEAHKARFRMEKLVDFFPHTIEYHLRKVAEAVRGKELPAIGTIDLSVVEKALAQFKDALSKRASTAYDAVDYVYKEIDFPLSQIKAFLVGTPSVGDPRAIEIFISYVGSRIEELRKLASEIDAYYQERA